MTSDVHMSLKNMAKSMLKSGCEIPGDATRRDLEILANSKQCDRCGLTYEDNSDICVCPNCTKNKSLSRKADAFNEVRKIVHGDEGYED